MSKLDNAIYEIHDLDDLAVRDTPLTGIHPLIKLLVTVFFIILTVSFDKYQLSAMLPGIFYILLVFLAGDIPFGKSMKKLRIILPLVCMVGLFNVFFDRIPVLRLGTFVVTGGMMSAVTLMLKGVFSVLASYLLIATTGIDKICYALRLLHLPKIIVLQLSLTYRYITVLLGEANTIFCAYILRAPRQKGVHFKVWGPLIGQLLLRSMDRANDLYDSMVLRGYRGAFYVGDKIPFHLKDWMYLILWTGFFVLMRCFNLVQLLGGLFV
ncbi:MAG: cobalt ECF transporter T component CbiQ [Lachnospiraceae bacterium]|nr:cobalt ECF transporter T component CbiQ [Lachnospiraceae bacterium]